MDLSTKQGRREQGQRLQRAVERAGLSIEELAGRVGCSRALIYQYVSGTTLAQPDRLQQIAAACGVSLAYFYEQEPSGAEEPAERPATPAPSVAPPAPTPLEVTTRLTESLRVLQELAEAQEGPPNYRALASTCERIVSLSAQVGDRVAQARAQKRLGSTLLKIADYPRAADALTRAVTLASEAGDIRNETAARQSLGHVLVQMGRTDEAREQFQRIAEGAIFSGRWQGTLSLGSIHEQYGEYKEAMQRFDEAAGILEEGEAQGLGNGQEITYGLLYVNTNRRNVYLAGGDFRGARPLAERCLADAEALGNADQHLEARFDLAWSDFFVGRWPSAYRGLTTTLQLARFVADQGRETMVRAWLGIFLAASGDHNAAIEQGKDALSLALSRGDRQAELYSQLALADAYTGIPQRDLEARYHTNQALAVTTSVRYARSEVECRLRSARLYAREGVVAELREAATRAVTLAQRLGARHLEALGRCRLSEAFRLGATSAPASTEAEAQATWREDARREATLALELAENTEAVEPIWRAREQLALLALSEEPPDFSAAELHLREAVAVLEPLRAGLIEAGLPDTLLENVDCAAVYELLARLLYRMGRPLEAEAFLEQTGWPPLTVRVEQEQAGEQG